MSDDYFAVPRAAPALTCPDCQGRGRLAVDQGSCAIMSTCTRCKGSGASPRHDDQEPAATIPPQPTENNSKQPPTGFAQVQQRATSAGVKAWHVILAVFLLMALIGAIIGHSEGCYRVDSPTGGGDYVCLNDAR